MTWDTQSSEFSTTSHIHPSQVETIEETVQSSHENSMSIDIASPMSETTADSHQITEVASPKPVVARRSNRSHAPPSYVHNYVCNASLTSHRCNLVGVHSSFHSSSSIPTEPASYSEAANDSNWVQSMQLELQALECNHTWD